ncbi:MAG: chorismate synthase [Propionibacteriaceae bacterium]|jgi:chorismate synthase|nr:chorismate synthase [Propionibacteriaceae bacterium]
MLRYLTAGESHGPALVATIDGLPAHIGLTTEAVAAELARRRLGHGRGARMGLERDRVTILGGVRHGQTLGSPVVLEIANSEWPRWSRAMAADPPQPGPPGAEPADLSARDQPLTRPRPGHADLAGMQKYDWDEARPILERASARETAARVGLGAVAKAFLDQALGIKILSHVIAVGPVASRGPEPGWAERAAIEADPCRCADPAAAAAMRRQIDAAARDGDTLGGVFEILVFGCPPGLGSHVQADRRLDARLAGALMGVQAIKGVEVGAGFALAASLGSQAHDELTPEAGGPRRLSRRAGGVEGGMSTGQVIRLAAAMKPIPTVPHALRTVDVATGLAAVAHPQRSDVCAVPAAGVVGEAVVALVLAEVALDKFGGDTVAEVRASAERYRRRLAERGLLPAEWEWRP